MTDNIDITYNTFNSEYEAQAPTTQPPQPRPLPKFYPPPLNDTPRPEINYKLRQGLIRFYIIAGVILVLSLAIPGFLWLKRINFLLFIISSVIAIPVFLVSVIMILIRFWFFDKKKIGGKIIKTLSKNFIILNIFLNGKRLKKVVALINSDGKTATDGKKDYMIDLKGIWQDENGHPNVYVLDNLPNNILFDFSEDLNTYVNTLNEKQKIPTKDGKMIDVSYSAENLQLLKKDKIFSELHRNPEAEKLVLLLIGIIALMIIAYIIVSMLNSGKTP